MSLGFLSWRAFSTNPTINTFSRETFHSIASQQAPNRIISRNANTRHLPLASEMNTLPRPQPPVKVLIAGGSYAGLAAAAGLLRLASSHTDCKGHGPQWPNLSITVVDKRDGFYHAIGSPLAMLDRDYSKKAWVHYDSLPGLQSPAIKFLQGSVVQVDCAKRTASVMDSTTNQRQTHHYDYFMAASGLKRAPPVLPSSLTREQYLDETGHYALSIEKAENGITVVGGGAVGVERAATIKAWRPHLKVRLIHSRRQLLSSENLPEETKERACELLKAAGIEVLLGCCVLSVEKIESSDGSTKHELRLNNGSKIVTGEVLMATSRGMPTADYLPASAISENGFIKINPNLSFTEDTPNAHCHFAAGDICRWPGIKQCGGAIHQGQYVAHNIYQSMLRAETGREPEFQQLEVMPPQIALSMGKNAVVYSPQGGTMSGESMAEMFFQDDMALKLCTERMGLGLPEAHDAQVSEIEHSGDSSSRVG